MFSLLPRCVRILDCFCFDFLLSLPSPPKIYAVVFLHVKYKIRKILRASRPIKTLVFFLVGDKTKKKNCFRKKEMLHNFNRLVNAYRYPGYQRSSFQRKYLDLWRPTVEILSRMCQSDSCRKNQRWRANLTILMSSRLCQYTCWLLMNSLEASKCNWNEFRSKEFFYTIPKCISNY